MARALWKGSISFGLVNIPIELHTAVRDHRPKFRMLHAQDKSPVKYERVCIRDGHAVAWEDLVKGYEYAKGHFVILTKDDFKAAAVEKTRTIDIIDFVQADAIDDHFFETPYYIVPQKRSTKAYVLLREALKKKKAIAVATFVLRTREHLCALMPVGDAIMLEVLRFGHELRKPKDMVLPGKDASIGDRELAMAEQLIEGMMTDWEPAKYRDHFYAAFY